MNHYELMVIYSPNLTEDEQRQQFQQVEELLKHENARINLVDHWGKRKLAYLVKKQRQGIYDWFYFELDPSRIAEIDRKLKMSEVILRFMIIKMEKLQVQNLNREIQRRTESAQQQQQQAEQPVAPAEPAAAPVAEETQVEPEPQAEESTAEPAQEG
ncbi:30S ribosomal protein S6 [bacterium]|nr:30S ribosomal protein S6 [bacterium]